MFATKLVNVGRLPIRVGLTAFRPYHEYVIDHYENPRNVGSLDKTKQFVGTGKYWIIQAVYLVVIRSFVFITECSIVLML